MSTVTVVGSTWNSSHVQDSGLPTPQRLVNVHSAARARRAHGEDGVVVGDVLARRHTGRVGFRAKPTLEPPRDERHQRAASLRDCAATATSFHRSHSSSLFAY